MLNAAVTDGATRITFITIISSVDIKVLNADSGV
jgi:hypothetical protein